MSYQNHIKNARRDFAHKLSTRIVKNHDIICVESLSVKSLLENSFSSLSRSISDAAWSQFLGFLKYKVVEAGKLLLAADRYLPSTQQCHRCGRRQPMALSDRIYSCTCGCHIDRDINSAIVLKNECLKAAGISAEKLVELPL